MASLRTRSWTCFHTSVFQQTVCMGQSSDIDLKVQWCLWDGANCPLFLWLVLSLNDCNLHCKRCVLDHSNPSKPSHRLTNGPKPSKTIESDGSKTKNHWKTIDGNGQTAKKHSMVIVASKTIENLQWSLQNHWNDWWFPEPLNLSMVSPIQWNSQCSLKRMDLSCGHNYHPQSW